MAPNDNSYLLLVTSVNIATFTSEGVAQFDRSPYEGIAVPVLNAYDVSAIPSVETMQGKISEWKKTTRKDLWPWIYLNRMIGADPGRKAQFEKFPYFNQIVGMDLEGKTAARRDFLDYWRNCLRVARATGAPGIVVDLEFYNFYGEYDVGILSRQLNKKPTESVDLLKGLGREMAKAVATEYPAAKLWFLFTDLANPSWKMVEGQPYYASPAYIVFGLLDGMAESHVPAHVISGGEVGLGYCHESLAQLQMKIRRRSEGFAPQLAKYSKSLELAGTLTLFRDEAGKSGWMKERCAPRDATTVEDLQAYLNVLMGAYSHNWIYASGTGSYYALQPGAPARFDATIAKAKASARRAEFKTPQ